MSDDIVGRFRSGHQLSNRPVALSEWRVTTGDPEVAAAIYDLLGGDAPQEWEAKGEDNLEVFTASKEIDVLIESPRALRQRMVLWGRNGKPILASDGEFLLDDSGNPTDERDPDAELSFQERKAKGQAGTGPTPDITLFFRLADNPDLGVFKFNSGSWSLASDLVRYQVPEELEDVDGTARATLKLEEVSFVAKNGPRAGSTVTYTKPVIEVKGAVQLAYALA